MGPFYPSSPVSISWPLLRNATAAKSEQLVGGKALAVGLVLEHMPAEVLERLYNHVSKHSWSLVAEIQTKVASGSLSGTEPVCHTDVRTSVKHTGPVTSLTQLTRLTSVGLIC